MKEKYKLNDYVLLFYDKRRRWIRQIEEKEFHCNFGYINLSDLIDKKYGHQIQTNKGKWIKTRPPSLIDLIESFQHESQVIYAKDAAAILLLLDIKPGDVVYEVGTGSGALTAVLSRYVGKEGKVITHEMRSKAYQAAMKNIKRIGGENVEFHPNDVFEHGFALGQADSIFLDLADPWKIIDKVIQVLKVNGRIVIFQPTFNQLEKTTSILKQNNFEEIKAIELLEREIQLKSEALRPATRMIGHTGYLISAIYFGNR
ncbi:MAG: tRNA (adenine-N1)-methyltransferase [Candidatus Kariarchaeaceae archaeon]|jgi:tRNA (adenine57-N1/adenine58-N1)-methyltransferase